MLVDPDLVSARASEVCTLEFQGNQSDFADAIGWKQPTLSRALNRKTKTKGPYEELARAIAAKLPYSFHALTSAKSLLSGQGDGGSSAAPKVSADTSENRPGEILVYPVAPHGHGAAEVGQSNTNATPIAPVQIPALLMRRWTGGRAPAEGFWTFAVGNSMEPFIPDGHPVFVEPIDGPLVDGARYAVWLGEADEDVIKRVSVGPGGTVTLYGDNPAVRSRTLQPTDNPEVWKDGKGTVRLVIQGRVILPSDTAPAIIGQITEFARSLIRPYEP